MPQKKSSISIWQGWLFSPIPAMHHVWQDPQKRKWHECLSHVNIQLLGGRFILPTSSIFFYFSSLLSLYSISQVAIFLPPVSDLQNLPVFLYSFLRLFSRLYVLNRRKIRLIEGNAKSHHLKKFTCKETLRQVFICLRPRTPNPPLHTVYVYIEYLFTQGRGAGEFNRREGERGNSSQSWVENTNMTDCISSL